MYSWNNSPVVDGGCSTWPSQSVELELVPACGPWMGAVVIAPAPCLARAGSRSTRALKGASALSIVRAIEYANTFTMRSLKVSDPGKYIKVCGKVYDGGCPKLQKCWVLRLLVIQEWEKNGDEAVFWNVC